MTLAFVFPGQGSQVVGMGKALAESYPAAKAVFEEVAPQATAYFNDLIAEEDAESLGVTLEQGAEVVNTDLEEWRAAMQPFWESYGEKIPGGVERINQIVAVE